jgi:hypothetical protein
MPARTAKGKIARDEWPTITARRRTGETFVSIARTYGCTAPAIRYIVQRGSAPTDDGPRSGKERSGRSDIAGAGEDVPVGVIDSDLRDRVNSDIAAFLIAFETMLENATVQNRRALLEATDRLMRAGARTRICLAG